MEGQSRNREKLVLVLQGGGALGAYQGGAYAALCEAGLAPEWVAGISIGAINSAIIAGNPPERRVERLRQFWDLVSSRFILFPVIGDDHSRKIFNEASAALVATIGVPGFFEPRFPPALLMPPGSIGAISFYDTAPLKATLEELVDFDLLNSGKVRCSVGAVQVATGNMKFFDSAREEIRPEHIMASGALPPGFPPVEIDGEVYWDGGLVSNTPLQYVLDYVPRRSRLAFQVDVFQGYGQLPRNLEAVSERDKDIRYSSRTRVSTDAFREKHEVRHAINELHKLLPEDLADTEQARRLYAFGCVTVMDIVQLIYRPPEPQG